jgi:hypothetical protein
VRYIAAVDAAVQYDKLARFALVHVDFYAVYAHLQTLAKAGQTVFGNGWSPFASTSVGPYLW